MIYSYMQLYQHEWKRENVKFEFSQFRQVLIYSTVYQYGKKVLYLFYNIAQRNIKK